MFMTYDKTLPLSISKIKGKYNNSAHFAKTHQCLQFYDRFTNRGTAALSDTRDKQDNIKLWPFNGINTNDKVVHWYDTNNFVRILKEYRMYDNAKNKHY